METDLEQVESSPAYSGFEKVELDDEGRAKTERGFASLKSRGWLLTLPASHYTQDYIIAALSKTTFIGQKERGKNKSESNPDGYEHYQVYIESENAIRGSTLKNKFPKGHFEVRRGTVKQAYEYCSKQDTRIGEPFQNGDMSVFIKKSMKLADYLDLINRGMSVADIITSYPMSVVHAKQLETLEYYNRRELAISGDRDLLVVYLWGATGVGKTHSILERHGRENVYQVSDYKNPFDGYDGQRVLVLDEFRSQLPVSLMLKLLDPYPFELPARYRDKWAMFSHVYVVSNIPLTGQYPNVRVDEPETFSAFSNRFDEVIQKTGINWREKKRRKAGQLDLDV